MVLDSEDPAVVTSASQQQAGEEGEDDDNCVICFQTLHRPAKTECGHTTCQSCLLQWALAGLKGSCDPDMISRLPIEGIKFKCPTCRTYTTARLDGDRDALLQTRYPDVYALGGADVSDLGATPDEEEEGASQTMALMVGNAHRNVPPSISPYTGRIRTHEWTFFVLSSRPDIIDKVRILLHPTFRDNRYVLREAPPFSTTQLGWGYFEILGQVQLQEGWRWVDEDKATSSSDDRPENTIPLKWLLDFYGGGSQETRYAKFRRLDDRDSRADSAGAAFDLTGLSSALDEFGEL